MRELITTSVVLTEESIGKYYINSYGDILKITGLRLNIYVGDDGFGYNENGIAWGMGLSICSILMKEITSNED